MKGNNEDINPAKKIFSIILVCAGGLLVCAAANEMLAKFLAGEMLVPELISFLALIGMGWGLIYGGTVLWWRWRMGLGIFLLVMGFLFTFASAAHVHNQTPVFAAAMKKAGSFLGWIAFISGIWLLYRQRQRDKQVSITRRRLSTTNRKDEV